jgi:tRNA threonylcarbamoyl adenosine modification protein (Sua5/YciO/YrdC/YwlC family)
MQRFQLDPESPRPDLIARAADTLRRGGLLARPTDTTWSVVCDARDRSAAQRLGAVRAEMAGRSDLDPAKAPMSLVCADLKMVGTYTLMNQPQFRFVKELLPGPFTVILPASREVPKVLQSKRRDVGVRMPNDRVTLAILAALDAPVLAATCQNAVGELLGASPDVESAIGRHLAGIIETEAIVPEPSTVVDYTGDEPSLVRQGKGIVEGLS